MASGSVSFAAGTEDDNALDRSVLTFGTLAPNADDFEFRWNIADTNSNVVTRNQIILALQKMITIFSSNEHFTQLSEQ